MGAAGGDGRRGVDWRGVGWFLALTFAVTYVIEGALILSGFRFTAVPALYGQLVLAGVMWVPALAALWTVTRVTGQGVRALGVRFAPWRAHLGSALAVPAVFALIYAITWLLGLGSPDWELASFRRLMAESGAPLEGWPPSGVVLASLFAASVVLGPTINGVFGFGEELGWRGYLLPALMPLGKVRAYLLVGIVWGLWHAPVVAIGFNYPGYPVAGIVAMAGLTTALGVYLNEMTLRHRSSVLAGWIHGAINGQAYGVWRLLFPDVNPLWGGMTGVVAMLVWTAVGLWVATRRDAQANAPAGRSPRPA